MGLLGRLRHDSSEMLRRLQSEHRTCQRGEPGLHRTHPASVQLRCENRDYFFAGSAAAGAGVAGFSVFVSVLFFSVDFFSVFAASFLAASSARAANEVARMRAAISFFMVLLLGLGTAGGA